MSSRRAPHEVRRVSAPGARTGAAAAPRCRLVRLWRRRLRRSMTLQIWLAITVMATLLVAGSSLLVLHLSRTELADIADTFLLGQLSAMRHDIVEMDGPLAAQAPALVRRVQRQLGPLQVAILDASRRPLALGEPFSVPWAQLPSSPLDTALLPDRLHSGDLPALRRRLGPVAADWRAADGRLYRYTLGWVAVPQPEAAPAVPAAVLVALALDAEAALDFNRRTWTVILLALVVSALTAGLVGAWLARYIVHAARQLGEAAGRIQARPDCERLELARLPRELREAGEAFNRMLDRVESAFAREAEFSADLAHDLRTPINNLLGEAQVALSRPRSAEEYRAVLESAVEDYERISRLIENMLFLVRAEHTAAALRLEWVDGRELAGRVGDYFEALAEERGVQLLPSCGGGPDGGCRVWADRTLLARAVGNLLNNALRYAPRGSAVRIVLSAGVGGAARVDVANDGPPIPAELHERIFERLFRGDPSREGSAQGSGLGLAIVRSIMALHGGRVSVSSAPGAPTVFTLWFPGPAGGAAVPDAATAEAPRPAGAA